MGRKHGFSFSWKRASGLSAMKGRASRSLGIPLTRSGRQRKMGRAVGCLVMLAILPVIGAILIAAAPASQPASRPSSDSDLRAMIFQLQTQLAALKKENAALKQRATIAETALAKRAEADAARNPQQTDGLQVGMSMEEAQAWPKIKGLTAVNTGADADGSQIYEWRTVEAVDGKGYHVVYYATFKDGKLVRHWREADPMAPPRSGTVVH